MGRRTWARTAVAAGVASVVLAAAPPATAVEAGELRVDPDPTTQLGADAAFAPPLLPGTAARYTIRVSSRYDRPVEVLVYGADVAGAGAAATVGDGTRNEGVGAWISTPEPRLALDPGLSTPVEFTVARPAGDEDGGVGAVVVQLSDASRRELGLTTAQRAAIRVVVAPDGGGVGPQVGGVELRRQPGVGAGPVTLAVTLANPTTTALQVATIVTVPWSDDEVFLPPTLLSPGVEQVVLGEATVPATGGYGEVEVAALVPGVTVVDHQRAWLVPPWAAALLVLLAGGAVRRARRSNRSDVGPATADDTVTEDGEGPADDGPATAASVAPEPDAQDESAEDDGDEEGDDERQEVGRRSRLAELRDRVRRRFAPGLRQDDGDDELDPDQDAEDGPRPAPDGDVVGAAVGELDPDPAVGEGDERPHQRERTEADGPQDADGEHDREEAAGHEVLRGGGEAAVDAEIDEDERADGR